jgi:hypothetical protein
MRLAAARLGHAYLAVALCLLGCGGAARDDKKTRPMNSPAAAGGGAGADALVPPAASGSAGASGFAGDGGTGLATNQAGNPGAVADAGTTADAGAVSAVDGGSFACGASACASGQLCVTRKCGGGPVQCLAATDGGCPQGWHSDLCPTGPFANQSACMPDPCTPPAPECVDIPASCASTPDCTCLSQTIVCRGLGCQSIVENQVICKDAQ